MVVVIEYADGSTFEIPYISDSAAELFFRMEGDHAVRWYKKA